MDKIAHVATGAGSPNARKFAGRFKKEAAHVMSVIVTAIHMPTGVVSIRGVSRKHKNQAATRAQPNATSLGQPAHR